MAVYESFYGCEREPFSLSPDPDFLFGAAPHREALAQLQYLVHERKGFAVITGEVGTGKTMLVRAVIEGAGSNVQTVYVFNPIRTRESLYAAIADELGLHLDAGSDPYMALNRHFLSTYQNGGTVVLIFDEAQALPIQVLEEIRLLTNIETSRAKLVQVILAGQTELDALIDSNELRALRQRLVFRYSLGELDASDTAGYIAARMTAAGAKSCPFTESACGAIHEYSKGTPRLINVICDNALLSGYAAQSTTIDVDLIDEAVRDLKIANPPPRPRVTPRPAVAPVVAAPEPAPSVTPNAESTSSQPVPVESRPSETIAAEPAIAEKHGDEPSSKASSRPTGPLGAKAGAPKTDSPVQDEIVAAAVSPATIDAPTRHIVELRDMIGDSEIPEAEALRRTLVEPRPSELEKMARTGSLKLGLVVALSVASLIVALAIGTLMVLERPADSSTPQSMHLKSLQSSSPGSTKPIETGNLSGLAAQVRPGVQ
jgi:general secretion pathway protein A